MSYLNIQIYLLPYKTKTYSIDWHLQIKFFNYISLAHFLLLSLSHYFISLFAELFIVTNVVIGKYTFSCHIPFVWLSLCIFAVCRLSFYFVTWWKIRANKIWIKKNLHKLFTWIEHFTLHILNDKNGVFYAKVLIRPHKLYSLLATHG